MSNKLAQTKPTQEQIDAALRIMNAYTNDAGDMVIKRDDKPDIVFEGTAIKLPADPQEMALRVAAEHLNELADAQEQKIKIFEPVHVSPLEGAWALQKALERIFGFTTMSSTIFSQPTMVDFEIGPNKSIKVMWGKFKLPGMGDDELLCGIGQAPGIGECFCIKGEVTAKHKKMIEKIAHLVREIAFTESPYKGKAISFKHEKHPFTGNVSPVLSLMDITRFDPNELIFEEKLQRLINANLMTPIRFTDACREAGIPIKRGILLAGKFGVGKSLLALATAQLCEQYGWTFLMVPHAAHLAPALQFAKRYQPCVVFTEDVDKVTTGDRTTAMNALLNTLDGVDTKGKDIITVLTTNDLPAINPAMLRPGRLDAVITVTPPDAVAAEKLIRLYARGFIDPATDLTRSREMLAGKIPAIIREAVERSKLIAISRTGTADISISDEDVEASAFGLKQQQELIDGPSAVVETPYEVLGKSLATAVIRAYSDTELPRMVKEMERVLNDAGDEVIERIKEAA